MVPLLLPTDTLPKFRLIGDRLTAAVLLPLRLTDWFPVPALSLIVTLPEAAPVAVGENVTWIVQVALVARVDVQPFVALNGAAAVTLDSVKLPAPVFLTVMIFAELVVPTTCDANERLPGEIDAVGATPMPVRGTPCDEPRLPELSVTFSVPLTVPNAEGANVTETVQPVAGLSVPLQVLVCAKAPPVATLRLFSG